MPGLVPYATNAPEASLLTPLTWRDGCCFGHGTVYPLHETDGYPVCNGTRGVPHRGSASLLSICAARRIQRRARSRCTSLRSGSVIESASRRHSSARARNLLPVIMEPAKQEGGQPNAFTKPVVPNPAKTSRCQNQRRLVIVLVAPSPTGGRIVRVSVVPHSAQP
jgi:hypothetical protein